MKRHQRLAQLDQVAQNAKLGRGAALDMAAVVQDLSGKLGIEQAQALFGAL